jgi:hypothetical protein
MIKSRHNILMPTLVHALKKTRHKQTGAEYKTSFGRNIHERTYRPVLTIEDAVAELRVADDTRTPVEKATDDFFFRHLPDDIM